MVDALQAIGPVVVEFIIESMILTFTKKWLWYPPYPIRKPFLLARKCFPSNYRKWLKKNYPKYCLQRFEFEKSETPQPGPKISLITLVYYPKFNHFHSCVESVLAQYYKNFEWIIINNGVNCPRTISLLNLLAAHPRIIVINPPKNLGIVKGTSLAAERATGEWLVFLDQDDLIDSSTLSDVAKVTAFRPSIKFIYSDSDHCDEWGRRYRPLIKPGPSPELIMGTNYICHMHAVKKRYFCDIQNSGSKYDGSQDWDISLRALQHPETVYHIPKILYTQRVHPSQFSSKIYRAESSEAKSQLIQSQMAVLENYLKSNKISPSYEIKRLASIGTYTIHYRGEDSIPVSLFYQGSVEDLERIQKGTRYRGVKFHAVDGILSESHLEIIKTDYVAWVSCGLEIENPDWLAQMVGVLNRENSVSWITGSIEGDGEVKISEKAYGIPPGGILRVDLRREVDGIPQRWWVGRAEVVRRYLESGRQDLGQTRVIWDPGLKATRV